MADRQSIARREQIAIRRMEAILEEMGGLAIEKRLEFARKKARRNPAILLEAITDALAEVQERSTPDDTPIEGNVEANPVVLEGLKSLGIETKMDLFRTSDGELLRLPGVGVSTLRKLRQQQ